MLLVVANDAHPGTGQQRDLIQFALGVGIYTFFYEFVLKGISNYHIWFLTLRTIWRAKLFDRLLTVGGRS